MNLQISEKSRNQWLSFSHERGMQKLENIQEEFFSNADIVSEVSALVRESIQNSLDELFDPKSPNDPQVAVKVIFTLGIQTPELSRKYFSQLMPHAAAVLKNNFPKLEVNAKYLLIEDFNTRGLEGSVDSLGYEDSEENIAAGEDKNPDQIKHSFLDFEWTSGSSSKKSNNRGSWGVGKIVFPRASALRTYLVYSRRREIAAPEGNSELLFGHSILKYRWIDNTQYKPDSKWMINNSQLGPIPSSNFEEIADFKSDWNVSRNQELGTSILIPFCQENLTATKLTQSIIRDYFITILSGNLVVEIRNESFESTLIDNRTLPTLIENLEGEEGQPIISKNKAELQELCRIYLASLNNLGVEKFQIKQSSPSKINDWNSIEIPEEQQDKMSEALSNGNVLEIRVETIVPKTLDNEVSVDEFIILLKKYEGNKTNTVFYREGILIPDANRDSKIQDCISIVLAGNLAQPSKLANLLKDSEGPSHSDWQHLRAKFRGKYEPQYAGVRTLSWVKNSVLSVNRILRKRENVEDSQALSKFFPDPTINKGPVVKPRNASIHLDFRVMSMEQGTVELFWKATNFEAAKYEVHQMMPTTSILKSGQMEESFTLVNLQKASISQYRVVCFDDLIRVVSNVVTVDLNPPPPSPPVSRKLIFAINNSGDGFSVSPNDKGLFNVGDILNFRVAFKTRGMDSFGNWTPNDFELARLLSRSSLRGLEVSCSENRVNLVVTAIDFFAEWKGFESALRSLIVEETSVEVRD